MPNHISNQIMFFGYSKDISTILEYLKTDERDIDFNKIIKMPETLQIDYNKGSLDNLDWYRWSMLYWKTSRNAYDTYLLCNHILYFKTAYHGIPHLFHKLCNMFPCIKMYYSWVDEDINGIAGYAHGYANKFKSTIFQCCEESYEMFFTFNKNKRNTYIFKDGIYIPLE